MTIKRDDWGRGTPDPRIGDPVASPRARTMAASVAPDTLAHGMHFAMSRQSLLVAACSLAVAGCATGYHPMQRGTFAFPPTEGYAEEKLADGSYQLVYSTGPGTRPEEALALWHRRAKELCASDRYTADPSIDLRTQYVYASPGRTSRLDNPLIEGKLTCGQRP